MHKGSDTASAGTTTGDPVLHEEDFDFSLLRQEILKTVALPHYFSSAFDRQQVHRYLPVQLTDAAFGAAVQRMIDEGSLTQKGAWLHVRDLDGRLEQRIAWSRGLFTRHRRYLRILARLPWVRYIGLTGANAFESCRPEDDLDMFVVTAGNRLWLAFAAIIVFSRFVGRRDLFCVNYLVDEDHLRLGWESYYTAVQLMSMVTLVDRGIGTRLIDENRWVFRYVPNAPARLEGDPFYNLETPLNAAADARRRAGRLASSMNRWVYNAYADRLRRKYPEAFGKGIVLGEGLAKLHRVDYGDIYEKITGVKSNTVLQHSRAQR